MKTSKLFRILAIGTVVMALSASRPAPAQDYWGYSTDDPQQDIQIQSGDSTTVIDSTAFDSSAAAAYDSTADSAPYYTVNNYYYGDYAGEFIMPDYYQLYVVPGYGNGYYYGYDADDYPDNDGYYYWVRQNDGDEYNDNANGAANQGRTIGASRGYGNTGGNIVGAPKTITQTHNNNIVRTTAVAPSTLQSNAGMPAQHTQMIVRTVQSNGGNTIGFNRESAAPARQTIARTAPPQENYSRPQPSYTSPSQPSSPSFQAHSEPPAAHESFIAHASAPQTAARPGR